VVVVPLLKLAPACGHPPPQFSRGLAPEVPDWERCGATSRLGGAEEMVRARHGVAPRTARLEARRNRRDRMAGSLNNDGEPMAWAGAVKACSSDDLRHT